MISWSGWTSSLPAVVIRRRTNGTWSGFNSFGNGSAAYPSNNNSRQTGNDGTIISWCNMYYQPQYVKFYDGAYSTIKTLPSTYNGNDIQISNGYDFSNIKAVVFKRWSSTPYAVMPAAYDFNLMQKVNNESIFNYGRIAVISKDNSEIVYGLGDIKLDNKSIKFEFNTEKVIDIENLSSIMKSELFSLTPESILEFSDVAYIINRNSTNLTLSDVKFDVELLNSNDKVVDNLKDIYFNSKDTTDTKSFYKINCSSLTKGNYYLKVNCKVNGEAEFNINDCVYEENLVLQKKEYTELVIEENILPTEYGLTQNYPNPFNPTTTINYQIPKDGFVTLKIYDVLGKEVATLVNENKSTGRYNVEFNAGNLASGVYLYQVMVNDFVSTKKLVLLK